MSETERRDFLRLAFAGALAAAGVTLEGASAKADTLGAPEPFTRDRVLALAKELAKNPFKPPRATLPDPFNNLSFEQYNAIHEATNATIWGDGRSPYALEPLHRGFVFTTPVDIRVVEEGQARLVLYDRSMFDFGKL